jgi:type VI secretion system protein ImpA
MPLSFELDVEALAAPLEGEHPSGENLRATDDGRAVRSALRDLREEARRMERRADEGDASDGGWPAARSVWRDLRDRCLEILEQRSRDLEVAAMCTEALARTDGFDGLATGFRIIGTLVDSAWDTLYPIPDPEDGPADEATIIEERTLPLQRLVGVDAEGLLVPAILHIPLTTSRSDEEYALCHWRSSRDLVNEESEEKLTLAVERGAVSPAQFEQAVAATPLSQITEIYEEIGRAGEIWEALTTLIADKSEGQAVVPAGEVRDLLEECGNAIKTFAPAAVPQQAVETDDTSGETVAPDGEASEQAGSGGGIVPASRADAFQRLEVIAGFFERHDPHSLVAAQIRNIVRLGKLPRDEYYRQLLRDEAALSLLFRAAGLDGDGTPDYGGSEE